MNIVNQAARLDLRRRLRLYKLFSVADGTETLPPTPDTTTLFAEAVADNSNLEMDWLWLATQVGCATERRYALERALHINPQSGAARQALAQRPLTVPAESRPILAGSPCV